MMTRPIAGMVSPMLASAEPRARFRLVWMRLAAAAHRRHGLGTAPARRSPRRPRPRRADRAHAVLDRRRHGLGQPHDRDQRDQQQAEADHRCAVRAARRRRRPGRPACHGRQPAGSTRGAARSAPARRCRTAAATTHRRTPAVHRERRPGDDVVNVGSTRLRVATAAMVASGPGHPLRRNVAPGAAARRPAGRARPPRCRRSSARRTRVSRASAAVLSGLDTISATISPTSMTVTPMARMSVPNGSPTRARPPQRGAPRPGRRRPERTASNASSTPWR